MKAIAYGLVILTLAAIVLTGSLYGAIQVQRMLDNFSLDETK